MGKRFDQLNSDLINFIEHQKLFFVGTAADDGTINVSPKGFDALRVLSEQRIVWLNITGSGKAKNLATVWQSPRRTSPRSRLGRTGSFVYTASDRASVCGFYD